MGKLIAFVGPPGGGKTSVAMKAAIETYCCTKSNRIFFLSPDLTVPILGLLFPTYAPDEIRTLGTIIDNTDINIENILKNSVTVKPMNDFGVLGFKAEENKYSFPDPTPEKLIDLFSVLKRNSEYVFADCSDDYDEKISRYAIQTADVLVRVIPSDLKGMTWYSANKHLHGAEEKPVLNVVNVTDKDLYLPTDEICSSVGEVVTVLPYSRPLKQQMLDARLYERLKDGGFNRKLKLLLDRIMMEDALEDKILKEFPLRISSLEQRIVAVKADIAHAEQHTHPNEDGFSPMEIRGVMFTDKKAAGTELLAVCKSMTTPDPIPLGSYRGFGLSLLFDSMSRQYVITLKNECTHNVPLGTDIFGNIQRLDNAIAGLPDKLKAAEEQLTETKKQLETAKKDVEIPFPHEEDLAKKSARLAELDAMLSLDKPDNEIVDDDRDGDAAPERSDRTRETPQSR